MGREGGEKPTGTGGPEEHQQVGRRGGLVAGVQGGLHRAMGEQAFVVIRQKNRGGWGSGTPGPPRAQPGQGKPSVQKKWELS